MRTRYILAITVTAVAVAVFASTFAWATLYSSTDEVAPVAGPVQAGTPLRLRIPSLGINAAVQRVGIAKSGNLAVPTNFTDVGWYRGGTVPGATGSAVIDGHVDNGLGTPAVFKRLAEIKIGDEILVDTASGTLQFVVDEVSSYPQADVPPDKLFTRADTSRLNLVTCEGTWIPAAKSYDRRLVVYAHVRS